MWFVYSHPDMSNFFIYEDGSAVGPYAEAKLAQMLENGEIDIDTLVSTDGKHWLPFSSRTGTVPELVEQKKAAVQIPKQEPLVEIQAPRKLRGIGRIVFSFIFGILWLLWLAARVSNNPDSQLLAYTFSVIIFLFAAASRFRNIGYSGSRVWLTFIPLFNFYLLFQLLFYSPNAKYKKHKMLIGTTTGYE